MYKSLFKRVLDFLFSFVAIILVGWFMVLIAAVLYVANKGSGAFFLQERPGKNAVLFKVIKFKTMTDAVDEEGRLLPNELRITKIGRFLRKFSIDELPQLLNVIKGDMSLIGPRPLKPQYLDLYTPEQARRHEVRPGITGWAQINGRNSISWTEKFKLDVWYVDHCSFILDVRIIIMTIKNVFLRKGIDGGDGIVGGVRFNGHN